MKAKDWLTFLFVIFPLCNLEATEQAIVALTTDSSLSSEEREQDNHLKKMPEMSQEDFPQSEKEIKALIGILNNKKKTELLSKTKVYICLYNAYTLNKKQLIEIFVEEVLNKRLRNKPMGSKETFVIKQQAKKVGEKVMDDEINSLEAQIKKYQKHFPLLIQKKAIKKQKLH